MPKQFHLGFKESGFKKMLMKDLAEQLGISGSMVSRLAKRGMPTDSLERAQRWRKRHLEPGRVKGQRFDPAAGEGTKVLAPPVRSPAPGGVLEVVRIEGIDPAQHLAAVETAGRLLDAALHGAGKGGQDADLDRYRNLLRSLPQGLRPRLPVRVWVTLLDYLLSDESHLRTMPNQAALVSIEDVAHIINPTGAQGVPADEWWGVACDWGSLAEQLRAMMDTDEPEPGECLDMDSGHGVDQERENFD